MEDVIIKPPRMIMEVYQCLPEGTMAQIIHNRIYAATGKITFKLLDLTGLFLIRV